MEATIMVDAILSLLLVLMPFLDYGASKIPAPKPSYQGPPPVERAVPAPPVPAPPAEVPPVAPAD